MRVVMIIRYKIAQVIRNVLSLFNLHTFNSKRRFICFFLRYYDMEKNKNSLSVN